MIKKISVYSGADVLWTCCERKGKRGELKMKEVIFLTCVSIILGVSYILFEFYIGSNVLTFLIAIILILIIFQLACQYIDKHN